MTTTKVTFDVFEGQTTAGEAQALLGWWAAGVQCVEVCNGNASAYAKLAAKQATRNTEGTIRVNVSAVVRALKGGYTVEYFGKGAGIDHVKATLRGQGERSVKATPVKKVDQVEKIRGEIHGLTTAQAKKLVRELAADLGLVVI